MSKVLHLHWGEFSQLETRRITVIPWDLSHCLKTLQPQDLQTLLRLHSNLVTSKYFGLQPPSSLITGHIGMNYWEMFKNIQIASSKRRLMYSDVSLSHKYKMFFGWVQEWKVQNENISSCVPNKGKTQNSEYSCLRLYHCPLVKSSPWHVSLEVNANFEIE